ncbi:MAG: hypothetical protein ABW321_12835 [Polyangiales bacterium]
MFRRTGAVSAFISAWLLAIVWTASTVGMFGSLAHAQPTPAVNLTNNEDDSSRLPWRGSSLTFSQSLNANALSKSAQASYNPTYAWSFVLEPRWYFTQTLWASIDQRLAIELTDSDSTLRAQRVLISDTIVGVDTQYYNHDIERLGNLALTAGAHVIAPTSIASRAATMTLGTRLRAGATMMFPHVLDGAVIGVQGRYGHRFLRNNTLSTDAPYPCLAGGTSATECDFLGTLTTTRDTLSAIVSTSLSLNEHFSIELLVWLSYARGTDLPTFTARGDGYDITLPDMSTTHWRNERYLLLGASWTANSWLSLELSVIDYFAEKNLQGQNRGLFNPLDLMIGLTTSIAFDRLYLATLGHKAPPLNKP